MENETAEKLHELPSALFFVIRLIEHVSKITWPVY